jgi:hypothetical protein
MMTAARTLSLDQVLGELRLDARAASDLATLAQKVLAPRRPEHSRLLDAIRALDARLVARYVQLAVLTAEMATAAALARVGFKP